MADATYYVPGAAIHSFLMFAPFFALYEKKGMIIQGIFLWATGPMLASFITDNLMEQASIWCFFSIAQISTVGAYSCAVCAVCCHPCACCSSSPVRREFRCCS